MIMVHLWLKLQWPLWTFSGFCWRGSSRWWIYWLRYCRKACSRRWELQYLRAFMHKTEIRDRNLIIWIEEGSRAELPAYYFSKHFLVLCKHIVRTEWNLNAIFRYFHVGQLFCKISIKRQHLLWSKQELLHG